ncbi:hypothetical protein BCR33DRAFT_368963 [Rhizoclosmatium globosum]|uniref:SH3 domain-containing protein n=1 Tax=Rhizoclosmatium globosum TaxID=329046 RepID=A0A1Y1ZQP0_9FUNG|nr:hypothetical protein BCR33DRAFT_368963 [Rhizoclosmatium globosum]|eukprot:ORY12563.1 hypothetical protein BCR33DRAFT_368963 [Rhizoclosmatium globosum]
MAPAPRILGISIPAFITLIVCASVLVLASGIAVLIVTRSVQQKPTLQKTLTHEEQVIHSNLAAASSNFVPGQTVQAKYAYQKNLADELNVQAGDDIFIQHVFDDGWIRGMNLSTRSAGTFPSLCLFQTPRESSTINKRLSSQNMRPITLLKPTKQVI